MSNYTPTGNPTDATRYLSRNVRDEFAALQVAVNSKSDKLARSSVSTTSLLISIALKTLTVEVGKEFGAGETVFISSAAAPSVNNMLGLCISYDSVTGLMVVNVTTITGSGTIANWLVTVSSASGVGLGSNTFTGYQNYAYATVASHATTGDIWGAQGNQINWTGTAVTTAFPAAPQAGATRELICAAASSFTASANMIIEGFASGGTLQCSAGDTVAVRAVTTSQFRLTYTSYAGKFGGSDTTASAVDVVLTATSGRLQIISMSAAGKKVTLPSGLTLSKGIDVFVLSNTGDYRFSLHSSGGAFLGYVSPGQTLAAHCSNTSTAAGLWRTSGQAIDKVYSGNTAEVLNAVSTSYMSVAMLTATKAICVFRNDTTTFLNAVILNYGSTSGTPSAINAEASIHINIAAQTSAQATVVYKNATNVTRGYVLDVSGNTITPGAVATIDVTAAGVGTHLAALSATQLVCAYQNAASGTIRARVLDIATSTITPGAELVVDAETSSGLGIQVAILSSAKASISFSTGGLIVTKVKLLSISGSTLTATGTLLSLEEYTTGTRPRGDTVTVAISSTRILVAQGLDPTYGNIYLALVDVSGTTPVLLRNHTIHTGFSGLSTLEIGNLIKISAGVLFLNWTAATLKADGMLIRITSDDKILVSEISDKLGGDSLTNGATIKATCATLSATALMQVVRTSAGYLSAKTLEVAV